MKTLFIELGLIALLLSGTVVALAIGPSCAGDDKICALIQANDRGEP